MSFILWNPFSISYLVELILVLMIAIHFLNRLWIELKSGTNNYAMGSLFVTFFALGISIFFQFLKSSLSPDYNSFALAWISPFGMLSLAAYTHFAYRFPSKLKISSIEKLFVFSAITIMCIIEFVVAIDRHYALLNGYIEFRAGWMDLPFIIGFLWVLVIFFRQLHSNEMRATENNAVKKIALSFLSVFFIGKKLSKEASAARAFLYISLAPLVLVLILHLKTFGVVSAVFTELTTCIIYLGILFGFAIVFLNYAPDYSSFKVKLAGISLTATLAIMASISWIIGSIYVHQFEPQSLVKSGQTISFIPHGDDEYSYQTSASKYETDIGKKWPYDQTKVGLPFNFKFFGSNYHSVYVDVHGVIGFKHHPVLRQLYHRYGVQPHLFPMFAAVNLSYDEASDIYVNKHFDRIVITWHKFKAYQPPFDDYDFQIVMYRNGKINFNYLTVPDKVHFDLFATFTVPTFLGISPGSSQGEFNLVGFGSSQNQNVPLQGAIVQDYNIEFLTFLDALFAPIAYFIIFASIAIVILFPIFFHINLDRPLQNLTKGVNRFKKGELDVQVPVSYSDEIGFLTRAFNNMAKQQDELVNSLEAQVAERTKEATKLAEENARLEERNHLARELHDTVNQTLFSANLLADDLQDTYKEAPKKGEETLNEITKLNKTALSEMRSMLNELRPGDEPRIPLGKQIKSLIAKIEHEQDFKISLNVENDHLLAENIQQTFYRILQESFNNIIKHANASQVDILFDATETQAMLTINDNGIGFDQSLSKKGHIGLKVMAERAALIGAHLEISSKVNEGTTITLIWYKGEAYE